MYLFWMLCTWIGAEIVCSSVIYSSGAMSDAGHHDLMTDVEAGLWLEQIESGIDKRAMNLVSM